jgi:hypothetical protein
MYEDDFVKHEEIEFVIEDRKFAYMPVTAGQENDWVMEYIDEEDYYVDGVRNKRYKNNITMLNKCKVRNITKVPYTQEDINNIIGINKDWSSLNKDERWNLLSQLKPNMFSKIIQAIDSIDAVPKKKDL